VTIGVGQPPRATKGPYSHPFVTMTSLLAAISTNGTFDEARAAYTHRSSPDAPQTLGRATVKIRAMSRMSRIASIA
jgi:hypothetical protein